MGEHEYIENNRERFVQELKELVAIKSLSSDKAFKQECEKCADHLVKSMASIGISARKIPLKDLNPVVYGSLGNDERKKTICFYCHYDVQPASKDDGWSTEPFELTLKDGLLYGRGADDDKGQMMAVLKGAEAVIKANKELPVNLAFVFEGMEESGSIGFEDFLKQHKDLFSKVDVFVICDSQWFSNKKPAIEYGLRGIVYAGIKISGPNADLHSGTYGGAIEEPFVDLVKVMNELVDVKGKVLIPGFYSKVRKLTDAETSLYAGLESDIDFLKKETGLSVFTETDFLKLIMRRWREPTLSIHGIEGAFSGPGGKTVIPAAVTGKVSIRIVPDQNPEEVYQAFKSFVEGVFRKLNSSNRLELVKLAAAPAFLEDPLNNEYYKKTVSIIEKTYGKKPDYKRTGGSIPPALYFKELFRKTVVILPLGLADAHIHGQNEKISMANYINGMKLVANVLKQLFQ